MFAKEYIDAVDEMHQTGKERQVRLVERNAEDERVLLSALEKLSTPEIMRSDSDFSNILQFPADPKTIH
jgi:hypothetical protein